MRVQRQPGTEICLLVVEAQRRRGGLPSSSLVHFRVQHPTLATDASGKTVRSLLNRSTDPQPVFDSLYGFPFVSHPQWVLLPRFYVRFLAAAARVVIRVCVSAARRDRRREGNVVVSPISCFRSINATYRFDALCCTSCVTPEWNLTSLR